MESEIRLIFTAGVPGGTSHYRLVKSGDDIGKANEFLNKNATIGLSPSTVRTYAYDLLNFFRWLSDFSGGFQMKTFF